MTRRLRSWRVFIATRFPPGQYVLMVSFFAAAHATIAKVMSEGTGAAVDLVQLATVGTGCLAFFLLLRIYDEIKDYDTDVVLHPERPLVAGLITHRDLEYGILACIVVVLSTFGLSGSRAIVPTLLAIGYSLLMFREFFIPCFLRPRLTAYAITHTAVSIWLSATLLVVFTDKSLLNLDRKAWAFILASWCLFSLFEFGRKTFATEEERAGVDSYSSVFGRVGAVILACVTAACASGLLSYATAGVDSRFPTHLIVLFIGLLTAGFLYAKTDRIPYARVYREVARIYIVAVYAGIVFHFPHT